MEFEEANRRKDKRLRRRLLAVLDASRSQTAGGWVGGRFLFEMVDAAFPGGAFDGDRHAANLLHDLVAGGYAEHRDDRRYTWQREGLDHGSYRVTAKGTSLLAEEVPVDGLIEDARIRKDA